MMMTIELSANSRGVLKPAFMKHPEPHRANNIDFWQSMVSKGVAEQISVRYYRLTPAAIEYLDGRYEQ